MCSNSSRDASWVLKAVSLETCQTQPIGKADDLLGVYVKILHPQE